ncbi:hypothetical protein SAMN05421786_1223 [Chryseobacterium ureilyticum]|uniref:Uncharacterized protein n=1 Tax=Chryseobacterium ureilyticum TaxID=373668 RepID=A0A1N7QTJ0_9FLAO|nr:hypothetical protein [Chryseobacterium ureilyticum]SIT26212.1 hypothetical protein SAMN05421786_1223 [Chryseobacterium ureilyticum]
MNNNKFCCERLKGVCLVENSLGLNFRIIKYSEKLYNDLLQIKPSIPDKGFLITSGYKNSVDDAEILKMIINHCPFCGQRLGDFYKSDDYVQETIG